MTKINLITNPDIIYSDTYKVLLISPSDTLRKDFQQNFLATFDGPLDVYIYEANDPIEWLLNVFSLSNLCIIDCDNVKGDLRNLIGYFISKDKTYWLTNTSISVYNYISSNRIYDLSFLITGGKFESES